MITKQQQLEWLAKVWTIWHHPMGKVFMSRMVIGDFVRMTNNSHQITREEWQRERDKMSSKPEVDNSWHERGEFPPAGTVCEVYKDEWVETFIIGMDNEGYCVYTTGNQYVGYDGDDNPSSFRPIRTEREKAFAQMKALCPYPGSWNSTYKAFAEALYDDGYRKVGSRPSPI